MTVEFRTEVRTCNPFAGNNMNRIVFSLLAGLCVALVGCRSIGTVDSTRVAGSAGSAGPKWTTGLLSKLKLRPRSESNDRLLSLARLMEHHGRHEEATKMYRSVLENDPTDRTAFHRLGCLAVRRGEHDEGLEYFQLAASGGEVSAELLNDMGYVLYLKHDLKSAEAKLREALQKGPQFKSARNNLGLVLAEQGQPDEALAEFRAAGDEASAYANLAFVQTKLGQLTEAEKNYHRALELDPQQRQAAEALVQFAQMGQKIEALTAEVEPLADMRTVVDRETSPASIPRHPSSRIQLVGHAEEVNSSRTDGTRGNDRASE